MQRHRVLAAVQNACRAFSSHSNQTPRVFNTVRSVSASSAIRLSDGGPSFQQQKHHFPSQSVRAFSNKVSKPKKEKEIPVEQSILDEIDACLSRTAKNEYDPKNKPPGEWKLVNVDGLLNGEAVSNGMVCIERTYNDEKITLLSSSEVLIEETEYDDDEEDADIEMKENGFTPEGRGITGLLLIAIARPSRKLPLFFECTFDRFGLEIMRVHVGLGMAGFMMDEDGQSALLYHLYLSHKDRSEGRENQLVPGEAGTADDPLSASSPAFHTLDLDLQRRFEQYLKERRIDDRLMAHLMDEVLGRVHHRYFNFLEGMREWVAAPGDQAQGSAKQLE